MEDMMEKHEKTAVILGMEPTGHYWFNLGAYLQEQGFKPVHVNPHHVKKSKEMDDNNPNKNDRKDPKMIAALVNEGRFSYPYIPTGIYAEIRNLSNLRLQTQEEITRISDTTEFNGQKLLNGEFDLKGYTDKQEIKVNYCSPDVPVKEYTIKSIPLTKDADGNIVLDGDVTFGDGFPDAKTLKTELKDDLLTITGENGFEMRLDVSGTLNGAQTGTTVQDLKINATGIGAMRLQIGANEHQVLEVNIPAVSLQNMGIENVDVSTAEGADDAIDRVDGAIKYVSSVRGRLGAFQNRLESTINSLDITSENMTSAYSRIMDVDMAEEMTSYTTYQILAQAGTSMLAQANERPSQVLQLLQ